MNRRVIIAVLLLSAAVARLGFANRRSVTPPAKPLEELPADLRGWHLQQDLQVPSDQAAILSADDLLLRNYENSKGEQVNLFVAYYRSQQAGETMHSPKNCLPGGGWAPLQTDTVLLNLPGAKPASVNRYLIAKGGDRQLVLYWYEDQGRIIASEYTGKFYLIWDSIRTGRRDGAIMRVVVPLSSGQSVDAATNTALNFAAASLPSLQQLLPFRS